MAKSHCLDCDLFPCSEFPSDEMMFLEHQIYTLETLGSEFDPNGSRRATLLEEERALLEMNCPLEKEVCQNYTS